MWLLSLENYSQACLCLFLLLLHYSLPNFFAGYEPQEREVEEEKDLFEMFEDKAKIASNQQYDPMKQLFWRSYNET